MYQHKHFNLYLHENDELEKVLQTKIIERKTLHEWPLSCVEQLITREGRKWVYKSQFGPTVEAAFYAKARSELLVSGKTLYTSEAGHVNLLLEFIEAPLLADLNLSDNEVVKAGHSVTENIAKIEGGLPYYLDISTERQWGILTGKMLGNLGKLISSGIFTTVDTETIHNLKKWISSKEILAALARNVGFVHHDLTGTNIFLLPNGYRVIDWQRPILGPKELDLASLLESLNRDPLKYVDEGIVWILYLLRIEWFTECAVRWFPDGRDTYDRAIARLTSLVGKSASS